MGDQDEVQGEDLPPEIKDLSKQHVREWVLSVDGVDHSVAEILFQQDINGPSLLLIDLKDLKTMSGPATLIIHARDEVVKLQKEESTSSTNFPGGLCKPYPFHRYHHAHRYRQDSILDVIESGTLDLIEPCHKYIGFNNTPDEYKMTKFTDEVIRFASACMNSRTNGTIHFGIGEGPDFKHGQVLGVTVKDREVYVEGLKEPIYSFFFDQHRWIAHICIKPPRFVGVLNNNGTSSDKYVIEVDIVPYFLICEDKFFKTKLKDKKKKRMSKQSISEQLFIRDGASIRNILPNNQTDRSKSKEDTQFIASLPQLSQKRKQAEEQYLFQHHEILRIRTIFDPIYFNINGHGLMRMDTTCLKSVGRTLGPATLIIDFRDEVVKLQKEESTSSTNFPGGPCKPYPFCCYHEPHTYGQDSILDVTESGTLDFIEPCHEFKGFYNTPDEYKMTKFTYEVIRFGSACMNSHTNGTIHFGIGDEPDFKHGQVLGVTVEDKVAYVEGLKEAIDRCFLDQHRWIAHICIKTPRFVDVLNNNGTSSDKFVIEVDIVPNFMICGDEFFQTTLKELTQTQDNMDKNNAKKECTDSEQLFIRDGGSSKNILPKTQTPKSMKEYNQFIDRVPKLSQLRKQAEEKYLFQQLITLVQRHGILFIETLLNPIYSDTVDHFSPTLLSPTCRLDMNLAAQKVHTIQTLSKWAARIRDSNVRIKRSSITKTVFILGLPGHSDILDVRTRWNPLFLMMERFVEQYQDTQAAILDPRVKSLLKKDRLEKVTDDDIKNAEESISLMCVLHTSTLCVSSDRHATCGQIQKLENHFRCQEDDSLCVTNVKDKVCGDLSKRYQDNDVMTSLEEATTMDPRFKGKVSNDVRKRPTEAAVLELSQDDDEEPEKQAENGKEDEKDEEEEKDGPVSKKARVSAL